MQRHLYEHFDLQGHLGFLNDVSVKLIDKTDPEDLTKREDYWIHPLKSKHRWYLMLKMVFRRNSLYFASLIKVMDGLYLDNDFRTKCLSFYYFYCYSCCLLVFLLLFLVLLYCFIYYYYIVLKYFLVLFGYVRYYFVKLLESPIIYVLDVCIPFYVTFYIYNFSIAVLCSL